MAEPGEPRTLLEAMVRQRQLSWDEAAVDDGLVGFVRLGLDGVQAAKLGCAIAADYWDTDTPPTLSER